MSNKKALAINRYSRFTMLFLPYSLVSQKSQDFPFLCKRERYLHIPTSSIENHRDQDHAFTYRR